MTIWQTTALGALAGFTIYLGLPVARLGPRTRTLQNLLNAVAIGVLLFLVWDILSKAQEPIDGALKAAMKSGHWGAFGSLVLMLVLGLVLGLVGLVTIADAANRRPSPGMPRAHQLTLLVATGLGLHNFSEGLAIGQAASTGAIGFAIVLIVGFGLHNVTEGFAVAAPVAAAGEVPSWSFLGTAGLIGGGPTFLGTLIGYRVTSPEAFVLFLALAAGALFYVIGEMYAVGRRFQQPPVAAWGIIAGFLAAYATDLILTIGGA
ncbi:MAG TPA: zinc permease [bacterium]|nr:zinc permease [bacterium]